MKATEIVNSPGLYRGDSGARGYVYIPSPGVGFYMYGTGVYLKPFKPLTWNGTLSLIPPDQYTVNFDGPKFLGVTIKPVAVVFLQLHDLGVYRSDESVYTEGPVLYVIRGPKNRFAVDRYGTILPDGDVNSTCRRYVRVGDVSNLQNLIDTLKERSESC